jgi:hypothetical protein
MICRRCAKRLYSCGQVCMRELTCGHACQQLCHGMCERATSLGVRVASDDELHLAIDGECPPCPQSREQTCACGKQTSLQPCAVPYSCEQLCGKRIKCKNHTCQLVCHSGACSGCPNEGVRTCPCGKRGISLTHTHTHAIRWR